MEEQMKRIIVTCAAIIMLLSVYCPAVEKKERSSVPPPVRKIDTLAKAKQAVPPATPAKAKDTTRKVGPANTGPVKYDDFIDKNHNGIDDRKENLVKKDSAKTSK
jgi:hypothetical protein